MSLDQLACRRRLKVAGDGEHRVVRRVVGREKLRDIVEAGGGEVFHGADERMMKRVFARKAQRGQFLHPRAVRLIVHRPPALVHHDFALRVELLLRHCGKQLAHPIRFEPQRELELIRGDRFEVVGALEPRRSIQRSAGPLDQLEMFVGFDVGGALEQHVLEQMGEPGSASGLVRRSDVIPQVDRHDGRRMVLGQCHD